MNLSEAIATFMLAKRADGLAGSSLKWYESNLTQFQEAVGNVLVSSITTNDLRQHIVAYQQAQSTYQNSDVRPEALGPPSEATVEARKRALHAFFAWCADEYGMHNPMQGIKRKRTRPRPKAMSPGDFVKLFNATQDTDTGTRDRALLAFLADTGCRRAGALSLALSDLYMPERRALVYEKQQEARMLHFTAVTKRFLADWLTVRDSDAPTVFVNMKTSEPLGESGLNQMLKRLKERAGVSGRVNPHSMRHQFARQYIMNGGDIGTLARLLGHHDIRTTQQYYAVFTDDELGEMHSRYSPMGQFWVDSKKSGPNSG